MYQPGGPRMCIGWTTDDTDGPDGCCQRQATTRRVRHFVYDLCPVCAAHFDVAMDNYEPSESDLVNYHSGNC